MFSLSNEQSSYLNMREKSIKNINLTLPSFTIMNLKENIYQSAYLELENTLYIFCMLNTIIDSIRKFSNGETFSLKNDENVITLMESSYIDAYNLYHNDNKSLHYECFKNTQNSMVKIMEILGIKDIPTCPDF